MREYNVFMKKYKKTKNAVWIENENMSVIYSIKKHKELVRNQLIEMDYEQDVIDLWISFIE